MAATQTATAGPPRSAAARRGAIDTDTSVPLGIRTGSADAMRVTAVQKAMPTAMPRLLGRKLPIEIAD
jgi:hypothetical protein